jgi:hypothetical protein
MEFRAGTHKHEVQLGKWCAQHRAAMEKASNEMRGADQLQQILI